MTIYSVMRREIFGGGADQRTDTIQNYFATQELAEDEVKRALGEGATKSEYYFEDCWFSARFPNVEYYITPIRVITE